MKKEVHLFADQAPPTTWGDFKRAGITWGDLERAGLSYGELGNTEAFQQMVELKKRPQNQEGA